MSVPPFDGRTRGCCRAGEALFPEYDWMEPVKKKIKKEVIEIDPIDVILSKSKDPMIPIKAMQIANKTGFPLELLQKFDEKGTIDMIKMDIESQLFDARKEWETEYKWIEKYNFPNASEQYKRVEGKLIDDITDILVENVNILDCDEADLMNLVTMADVQNLLDRNKIHFKPI